jgi:hypothetical protein
MARRDSYLGHVLRRLISRDPARLPADLAAIPDPSARFAAAMAHYGATEADIAARLAAVRLQVILFGVLALGALILRFWPLSVVLLLLAGDRARMATELRTRRFYGPIGWLRAAISHP